MQHNGPRNARSPQLEELDRLEHLRRLTGLALEGHMLPDDYRRSIAAQLRWWERRQRARTLVTSRIPPWIEAA